MSNSNELTLTLEEKQLLTNNFDLLEKILDCDSVAINSKLAYSTALQTILLLKQRGVFLNESSNPLIEVRLTELGRQILKDLKHPRSKLLGSWLNLEYVIYDTGYTRLPFGVYALGKWYDNTTVYSVGGEYVQYGMLLVDIQQYPNGKDFSPEQVNNDLTYCKTLGDFLVLLYNLAIPPTLREQYTFSSWSKQLYISVTSVLTTN